AAVEAPAREMRVEDPAAQPLVAGAVQHGVDSLVGRELSEQIGSDHFAPFFPADAGGSQRWQTGTPDLAAATRAAACALADDAAAASAEPAPGAAPGPSIQTRIAPSTTFPSSLFWYLAIAECHLAHTCLEAQGPQSWSPNPTISAAFPVSRRMC